MEFFMIIQRAYLFLDKLIAHERSPRKLAATVCLGVYIGISPLVGFHTVMTFLFGWLFALNMAVLFSVSILIHNPWTTLPIYALDHYFGQWLFEIFNIDSMQFDPAWVESCNMMLKSYTGISGLSLSAFLVGGNLLALGISVMLYPVVKRAFTHYLSKKLLVVQ
jgi:uncharacterized protein (DUF2062 family)